MSFNIFVGNQTRAAQIARKIVAPLAVSDLDDIINQENGDG